MALENVGIDSYEGLEKTRNRDSALALREHMSDMSEDYHCAGWLDSLEFELWEIVQNGPRSWGFGGTIAWSDIYRLIVLSRDAGGWWRWSDTLDNCEFVTHEEWQTILKDRNENTLGNEDRHSKFYIGEIVTTSFSNRGVYLWDFSPNSPDFVTLSTSSIARGTARQIATCTWPQGSLGIVLEITGDWVKIVTSLGYTGWIGEWNVKSLTEAS
jgi:hypothetical protein